MSTRANIVVKDGSGDELIFYRHSDGYPEGALPTLQRFLDCVKSGAIRDNVGQAAGWLIVFGRQEYAEGESDWNKSFRQGEPTGENPGGYGWKVGAIEPTTGIHGDIEWLYVIDLKAKTIKKLPVRDAEKIPKEFYSGKFALEAVPA
jgi:hypothetical protein